MLVLCLVAVLPYHATEAASPTVGSTDIPYPKEVSFVSGTGDFTGGHKVRVFMPTRHQMQSGTYNTRHWEIRFESPRTFHHDLIVILL